MKFNAVDRGLINKIVKAEDLSVRISAITTNAIGDSIFEVKGSKADMNTLRTIFKMAKG